MKSLFLPLICMASVVCGQAANPDLVKIEVQYHCVFNRSFEREKNYDRFETRLYLNNARSWFFALPMTREANHNNKDLVITADTVFGVFKNFERNELVFSELLISGKAEYYGDSLHPMIWNISNETKWIDSLECTKATGEFRGRTYIAWFCYSIPLPNGPWKLGGLPGLVIEAYEENNDLYFIMKSFSLLKSDTEIWLPNQPLDYPDYSAYKRYWKELFKKMDGSLMASGSNAKCADCITKVSGKVYLWEKWME